MALSRYRNGARSLRVFGTATAIAWCGCFAPLWGQGNPANTVQEDVVRGTVVNRLTRAPIGRALVVSDDSRFATLTDDRGRFEFKIPPVAREQATETPASGAGAGVRVEPQAGNRPNFFTARKIGFLVPNSGMAGVPVSPEQQEVTIALVPEARIVGHAVLQPSSEGAMGMLVELYRRQVREGQAHWDPAGSVTVKSDGEFRFAELSASSYRLFTRELPDRDPGISNPRAVLFVYPPVYYSAAEDFAASAVIPLAAGETFEANLSPTRREYYPVKIAIANAAAGMQPDVQVWRQGHEGPGYSLGYDFREGVISGSLPNGSYTVEVVTNGTPSLVGSTQIAVSGAPALGGVVTLFPGATVTVKAREELEHPKPEYTATFSHATRGAFTASAARPNYLQTTLVPVEEVGFRPSYAPRPPLGPEDESLVFENVLPGKYRLRVQTGIGYVASIKCETADLLNVPLEVDFGSPPPPIEITVRDDGADVQGSVDGLQKGAQGGAPMQPPGTVYFLPISGSGQVKQAWIEAGGNFRVQQLAPGDYRVLAFDGPQQELEFGNEHLLSRYHARAPVISVVPGQSETVRLSLITGEE